MTSPNETTTNTTQKTLVLQRFYLKDASFEVPHGPTIFQGQWDPHFDVQINSNAQKLADDAYEVVLDVTVTARQGEQKKTEDGTVAFIVEIKQAGIFTITGLSDDELRMALGTHCPTNLFPYAREAISDLVTKGSFPQFLLAPINFDAAYQQHVQQVQQAAKEAKTQPVH